MSQNWNPDQYAHNAGFVPQLGEPLLRLLDAQPGERILDLGCGDGVLTVKLLESGARVVAIDSSASQIEAARQKGLDARVMDGHDLAFENEFDAVFSNAALHWLKDPGRVLAGVRRALKPGGRLVAEMGGKGNVAAIVGALGDELRHRGLNPDELNPWYFPDELEYRTLLERHGFEVSFIVRFDRPTPLPTDMIGWMETMAHDFVAPLNERGRRAVLEAAADSLAKQLKDSNGVWVADYVRLRFSATARP